MEAVLLIDSRGQIVIPEEVRQRANIQDEICCLPPICTNNLSSEVSAMMNSLLADKA